MKKILLLLCVAMAFVACNSRNASEAPAATKSLILYYSQNGSTRQLAQLIQQKVGADMEEITLVNPYDTNFQKTIERSLQERAQDLLPELSPIKSSLADYDTIYLGYPIWFGTYALPIASLLEDVDLTGKVIVPFCTFGSGGIEASRDSLMAQLPENITLEGYGVRTARLAAASEEIVPWLVRIGALPGEFVPMPEFGKMEPLTAESKTLFDEACGDYPMPLGTPVAVAKSVGPDTNMVCYETETVRPGGDTTSALIYVVKPASGKAEFVKVIR